MLSGRCGILSLKVTSHCSALLGNHHPISHCSVLLVNHHPINTSRTFFTNSSKSHISPHVITRNFSTSERPDEESPKNFVISRAKRKGVLKEMMKKYGLAVIIFEGCSYLMTIGVFLVLLSNGVQMTDILAYIERFVDVDYWTDSAGVDKSLLTGNASKFTLSLALAELVSFIKMPLDLALFFYLVRIGWIKPRTNSNDDDHSAS